MQARALTGSGGAGSGRDERVCISQIKSENLGMGDKAAYFSIKGSISFIRKENCLYKACPSPDCNKKLLEVQPVNTIFAPAFKVA